MYFEPRSDKLPDALTHNPFPALVAPRPIAWITSIGTSGVINLAPYSHYNIVAVDPPMVMFAPSDKEGDGVPKDTLRNVTEVREFVVNIASWAMRDLVNKSSAVLAYGESEITRFGVKTAPSVNVTPPRVLGAPAALECKVFDTLRLPVGKRGRGSSIVIGEVVGIYIEDSMVSNGRLKTLELQQLSRLGYFDYSVVREIFEMRRPVGG